MVRVGEGETRLTILFYSMNSKLIWFSLFRSIIELHLRIYYNPMKTLYSSPSSTILPWCEVIRKDAAIVWNVNLGKRGIIQFNLSILPHAFVSTWESSRDKQTYLAHEHPI